jgi:hypothetical protein
VCAAIPFAISCYLDVRRIRASVRRLRDADYRKRLLDALSYAAPEEPDPSALKCPHRSRWVRADTLAGLRLGPALIACPYCQADVLVPRNREWAAIPWPSKVGAFLAMPIRAALLGVGLLFAYFIVRLVIALADSFLHGFRGIFRITEVIGLQEDLAVWGGATLVVLLLNLGIHVAEIRASARRWVDTTYRQRLQALQQGPAR